MRSRYWTAERIKNLRKKIGLYGDEMGRVLSITRVALSYLENGRNEPSEKTVLRLWHVENVAIRFSRLPDCKQAELEHRMMSKCGETWLEIAEEMLAERSE